MNFFLMRHGEAELFASSDVSRELTVQGKRRLQVRLNALSRQLEIADCIIHSPYIRAQQTAELVNLELGGLELFSSKYWTPDSDVAQALTSLEPFSDRCPIIVTHMPLIARAEALCCQGTVQYPAAFSCGEIAQLQADWPAAGLGRLVGRL